MPKHIVLLGPPASGKGTQGRRLAELIGGEYFSTGRQLRHEMERGTELGEQARVFLNQGKYVTDEMALQLAKEWLQRVSGAWVLDGFPRTLKQANALDEFLGERISVELQAISLEGSKEIFSRRVLTRRECSRCSWEGTKVNDNAGACPICGEQSIPRHDDDEENFLSRWASFEELTKPALGYYVESDRILTVSGEGSPDQIFGEILKKLEK